MRNGKENGLLLSLQFHVFMPPLFLLSSEKIKGKGKISTIDLYITKD